MLVVISVVSLPQAIERTKEGKWEMAIEGGPLDNERERIASILCLALSLKFHYPGVACALVCRLIARAAGRALKHVLHAADGNDGDYEK